jgi:hypothetical protein
VVEPPSSSTSGAGSLLLIISVGEDWLPLSGITGVFPAHADIIPSANASVAVYLVTARRRFISVSFQSSPGFCLKKSIRPLIEWACKLTLHAQLALSSTSEVSITSFAGSTSMVHSEVQTGERNL